MVAVDMDGTFLDSQKEYDREWFKQLYSEMKNKEIRFVVASGNQYYQLKSFFPEIEQDISFVAENGAYVVSEGKEIFCGEIDHDTINEVLEILDQFKEGHTILCGKKSAYVKETEPESFIQHGRKYYHRLKKVPSLLEVKEDTLFKFALSFPVDKVELALEKLNAVLGRRIVPVSSGHGEIDLIISGMHKASGLLKLQEIWGISEKEIVAFGDSGNDLEMLAHVERSYAMANAQPKVKQVAKNVIPSNDEQGVLITLEKLLRKE